MARSTAQTVNIFSDTAVTVFGILDVKNIEFYISEGNSEDQPGYSSARVCAYNARARGRKQAEVKRNSLGQNPSKGEI